MRKILLLIACVVIVLLAMSVSAQSLPDVLNKEGTRVSNAPCKYQDIPAHCFHVKHKGTDYLIVTLFFEEKYLPIVIFTKEKEVWRYDDVRT